MIVKRISKKTGPCGKRKENLGDAWVLGEVTSMRTVQVFKLGTTERST